MTCTDIHELAPLWHSGELEAARRTAFNAHLAGCPACQGEVREQADSDRYLRESIAAEPLETKALEGRVMGLIANERRRRWFVAGGALAAAAALVAVVAMTVEHNRPVPPNPVVFAAAAHDHLIEVVQQAPRHWRSQPTELADLETSQGISDADVKGLEATGYRLERAKICRLGGARYMHLVYARNGREFSVYLQVRGGAALPEADGNEGKLQLSSFTGARVQAVIVTDQSRKDCDDFIRAAKRAL